MRTTTLRSRTRLLPLLQEVRACRLCEASLPLGPRPVLQLDARARLLIAGQAPGRRVHESGVPFQDPSGDRLREWLGVDTVTFYDAKKVAILPMGFCFPGSGRSGDLPPRPECADTWRTRLLGHLPHVELTLVIGKYAIAWHLPEHENQRLTEVVAAWKHHWPKVLPMPHPSPRNRRWLRENPWFERDVLPLLRARVHDLVVE